VEWLKEKSLLVQRVQSEESFSDITKSEITVNAVPFHVIHASLSFFEITKVGCNADFEGWCVCARPVSWLSTF